MSGDKDTIRRRAHIPRRSVMPSFPEMAAAVMLLAEPPAQLTLMLSTVR